MVGALEKESGLLKGYAQDVYKYDRKAVGAIWAPDSKYLWVVRENGSHLSRLGVCEKPVEVEVALRSMLGGEGAQRHCVWLIETSVEGQASIKKVSRQKALEWCAWRQYEARGGLLKVAGVAAASVTVGQGRIGPGVWGCDMAIQTHRSPVRRTDVLAAYCHGVELATKELGLFVKVLSVTVNGGSIDEVAPVFEVDLEGAEAVPA